MSHYLNLPLPNKSNKKPVINQPSIICHFFDKPKFVADEIWLLLTMWGQWTPFFEWMLQEFFPVPQRVSAIFCNIKYNWQRPLHLKWSWEHVKPTKHTIHYEFYFILFKIKTILILILFSLYVGNTIFFCL